MEIIIAVVVILVLGYWAFNATKEKPTGSQSQDSNTTPVEKAPDPVVATPVAAVVPEAVVEASAPVTGAKPAKKTAKPKAAAKTPAKAKAPAKTKKSQ